MRTLFALVLAALPLACGGNTSQDSTSTGGSAGTPSVGGAGGSGAVAGSGGSAGSSCAGYEDLTPPNGVTVRYVNALSVPIYVGGGNTCDPSPLYQLFGPEGPVPYGASGCGHTCQALQQHGDWCTDACMIPPVVMIAPGGSYDDTWSGTTFRQREMPASCYFEPQYAPPTCSQRIVAPAGSYGVSIVAGKTLTCYDVGLCNCTPDAKGSCQIPYGATVEDPSLATKASFEMPGTNLVTLTFN